MQLMIKPDGKIIGVYSEELDYTALGKPTLCRASYVEPDANGDWYADMSPVNGPQLGPFPKRSSTLDAELSRLNLMLKPTRPPHFL